jgi:hypothetical protein
MTYSPGFEAAWKLYPSRGDNGNPKALAFKAWRARLRQGVTEQLLTDCTREYAAQMRQKGKAGTEYVMQAATFYGPNDRFMDYKPKPKADPVQLRVRPKEPEAEERIDGRQFIREILARLGGKKSPTCNYQRSDDGKTSPTPRE